MYTQEQAGLLALQLLAEGSSIRVAERITRLHRDTIMRLLVLAGRRAVFVLSTKVQNVQVRDIQADEIWGFVRKKEGHKYPWEYNDEGIGDAWCFVGIERHSKLVLCFELGKRTSGSAARFMAKLNFATAGTERFQLTTDGLAAYVDPVTAILGDRVDYAQLIKVYGKNDGDASSPERRYSPGEVLDSTPKPIFGDPDKARICTSHIERQNLTMRTFIRRLTRLTCAFSKKWDHLYAALALHFAYYNFCRRHQTLKTSPAVAAGITDHVWTLRELLSV
jgi:IS1 family transposase